MLSNKLEIVIITYNRSELLKNTLNELLKSPFSNCKITVLNNCSDDNTLSIVKNNIPLFKNLNLITNKINIGGNANIIRAAEISNGYYTWILCDDDKYNFSNCNDIIEVIEKKTFDLIHVGAHKEKWVYGGFSGTPRDLLSIGYPYFKYSSFVPCSIFKTKLFYENIIDAYDNVQNWFPHLPYLISYLNNDKIFYIAKKRIVTAHLEYQQISDDVFPYKWINNQKYLKNKFDKILLVISQDISVNNKKSISINKIIFKHGLNFFFRKNRFICCKLFFLSSSYQKFLLVFSIILSPIWRLKYFLNITK